MHQADNRPHAFGVICRQLPTGSVQGQTLMIAQVLLHKVGRGPYHERKWAFLGGAVSESMDDQREQCLGGLLRLIAQACESQPPFQFAPFAVTTNPNKPTVYHVLTIPAGYDHWPPAKSSNETLIVHGHSYTTKHGFVWVDFGNLLAESKRRVNPQMNTSAVHTGVLQWFGQQGDTVLQRLGFSPAQVTAGEGSGAAGGVGSDGKRICKFIAAGETCPYAERCHFSHQTAATAPSSLFPGSPGPAAAAAASSAPATDPSQVRSLAEMFAQHYLQQFLTGADSILNLYQQNAILTFEGEHAVGPMAILQRLKAIQAQGINLQPNAMHCQQIPGAGVVVCIGGKLGTAQPPSVWDFSQVFHLVQSGSNWMITNHLWWLAKK